MHKTYILKETFTSLIRILIMYIWWLNWELIQLIIFVTELLVYIGAEFFQVIYHIPPLFLCFVFILWVFPVTVTLWLLPVTFTKTITIVMMKYLDIIVLFNNVFGV